MEVKLDSVGTLLVIALLAQTAVAQPTGDTVGVSVSGITCLNLTTGQRVVASASASSWDCAALGLLVSTGDRLQIGVRGALDPQPEPALAQQFVLPTDFTEHVAAIDSDIFMTGPAGDLDGDGDTDLLIGDSFSWFENLGGPQPSFVKHSMKGMVLLDKVVFPRLLDVDGDQDIDLTASVPNSGTTRRLSWFRNDGSSPPSFVEVPIDQQPDWSYSDGWGGDIDLDGDTDYFVVRQEILGCTACTYEIVWLENQGVSFARHLIESALGGSSGRFLIKALDLDSDGDLDWRSPTGMPRHSSGERTREPASPRRRRSRSSQAV
jgi:hypothetical protein